MSDTAPESPLPPGLTYIPVALAPVAAERIAASLAASSSWVGVTPTPGSRQVIHYGWRYDYGHSGVLVAADPIPPELAAVVAPYGQFDQLIVNRYEPGQGIAPHIDDPRLFADRIVCFTIGSGAEIVFAHDRVTTPKKLYVIPGSAYVMAGEARYNWTHGIACRKSDIIDGKRVARGTRISLTFRRRLLRG